MDSATARTAAQILRILPRERITRAIGGLTDAHVPSVILQPVLRMYSRAYGVDLAEAAQPLEAFGSFNEFFTRRLRDGARSVDPSEAAVVSPADGRLDDAGPIERDRRFRIKGQWYSAGELLDDDTDAARFAGGLFAVVYLSPRDYHRVHSPVSGSVAHVRHVPGTLFPVNAFGVRHVPQLLARNERIVVMLESQSFGAVAVVMVGAMIVGRMTLAFDAPARPPFGGFMQERRFAPGTGPRLAKGDEIGAFSLGSTAVVLIEHPTQGRLELHDDCVGAAVRMGQAIVSRCSE